MSPPSLHASGKRYEWLTPPDRCGLDPLPANVLALLTAPAPVVAQAGDVIPEGQRNDRLYRLVRSLMRRGLSVGAVHVAAAEENRARCRPPLADREVRELVEDALRQSHRPDFQREKLVDNVHEFRPDLPPRAAIEIVDAADLITREFADEPALVGGGLIVPRALVVNGGPAKRGKSILLLNREIRRAFGLPFLGFTTTPGRTLYIQAEIPEPQLKARLVLMLNDCPGRGPLDGEALRGHLLTVTRRGLFIDEPEGYDAVRRLIDQAEPDLLSLDPLARFMTGEENSARDVGRLINSLDRLIQQYGIAIELTHHAGKPTAGDPRHGGQRLRGSSALFGAADTVTMLDRTQEGRLLTFELRHAEEPAPTPLDRTPSLWFTGAGPSEKLLAIALIVKDLPMRYTTLTGAIIADTKCSEPTAKRLIRDAKKAGVIWQGEVSRLTLSALVSGITPLYRGDTSDTRRSLELIHEPSPAARRLSRARLLGPYPIRARTLCETCDGATTGARRVVGRCVLLVEALASYRRWFSSTAIRCAPCTTSASAVAARAKSTTSWLDVRSPTSPSSKRIADPTASPAIHAAR